MRRVGDFRPSCYDEKKALMRAKRELEFAEQQIKVVKQWALKSRHEFEEFNGRMSQLTRLLEGDVPRMCALLQRLSRTLERYTHVSTAEAMSLVATAIDEDAAEPAGNEPEHGESS